MENTSSSSTLIPIYSSRGETEAFLVAKGLTQAFRRQYYELVKRTLSARDGLEGARGTPRVPVASSGRDMECMPSGAGGWTRQEKTAEQKPGGRAAEPARHGRSRGHESSCTGDEHMCAERRGACARRLPRTITKADVMQKVPGGVLNVKHSAGAGATHGRRPPIRA